MVKWLAEFDNFREKRAAKGEKRVRFCQVAKLHFTPDCRTVTHLEEYAQSMTSKGARRSQLEQHNTQSITPLSPGVLWPDIEASSAKLWDQVRQEPGAYLTQGPHTEPLRRT